MRTMEKRRIKMKKANYILFISLVLLILSGANVLAQEDINIGKIYTMKSEVLGEDREILISLPDGYEENSELTYPVIYLLDGSTHFRYTSGIVKFLSEIRLTPQMIVVGIRNVDRMRDFTTPMLESASDGSHEHHIFTSGGGAENFMSFMDKELKKFVNEKFRTDSFQILAGHSVGGLFAINCMLNKPGLFKAYIAASPSLWWNNEESLDLATKRFSNTNGYDVKLYLAYGGIDGARVAPSCINFVKFLNKNAPCKLVWKAECLPDELHKTTPLKSIYNGLEFFYQDWQGNQSGKIKESSVKY